MIYYILHEYTAHLLLDLVLDTLLIFSTKSQILMCIFFNVD